MVIPPEYLIEAERVAAYHYKLRPERMGKYHMAMRALGFKQGLEPVLECGRCRSVIDEEHVLLKARNYVIPDVRMHKSCYDGYVLTIARVLFEKGRSALTGKYRGTTLVPLG